MCQIRNMVCNHCLQYSRSHDTQISALSDCIENDFSHTGMPVPATTSRMAPLRRVGGCIAQQAMQGESIEFAQLIQAKGLNLCNMDHCNCTLGYISTLSKKNIAEKTLCNRLHFGYVLGEAILRGLPHFEKAELTSESSWAMVPLLDYTWAREGPVAVGETP